MSGPDVHGAVVAAACVLAAAAALRSTWSPCGLSMLSTITPLGERGRGRSFRSTAAWFIAGAVVGGAMLGAALAPLALAARGISLPGRAALAAAASTLGAVGDLGLLGYQLPVLRRQVNERWLDQYRPWVYGAGFGWQVGVGLSTYVMTTAVVVAPVVGVLSGSAGVAFGAAAGFGGLRGLSVLLTSRLRGPDGLRRLHRRLERLRRPVCALVVAVQLGVAGLLSALLWAPAAAAAVMVTLGLLVLAGPRTRRVL